LRFYCREQRQIDAQNQGDKYARQIHPMLATGAAQVWKKSFCDH
jgi:hypothetical protein